ncbi:DUF87 domain-containing protein [Candidatus Woesebacteria bacterium]|nr:DUF87 domain-containing protein [Candidatus Woesebacteria bacterium]
MQNPIVLELRTGRDSESLASAAEYLFETIPTIKDALFHKLLGKSDPISFEILARNQTVSFYCVCPKKVQSYIESSLSASFPQILINTTQDDYIHVFSAHQSGLEQNYQPQPITEFAFLDLGRDSSLPIKTYDQFADTDPLSALLSTLSKFQEHDSALIQVLVSQGGGLIHTPATLNADEKPSLSSTQQAHIAKKMSKQTLKTSVRALTSAPTHERTRYILEAIYASSQVFSLSESNQFTLKKPLFFKKKARKHVVERTFSLGHSYFLNTSELATIWHLPNKNLATIPNIAWGKSLLGEPPENLPIITSNSTEEAKQNTNPFAKTIYKNSPTIYGIKRPDRRRHMYVIGKTGTGKSTLLANMAIHDIKKGEGLCVIDPHGDLVETLLDYIPSHRINDVVYFNSSDGM